MSEKMTAEKAFVSFARTGDQYSREAILIVELFKRVEELERKMKIAVLEVKPD